MLAREQGDETAKRMADDGDALGIDAGSGLQSG